MRLVPAEAKRPAARLHDGADVDDSDVASTFDSESFQSGGPERIDGLRLNVQARRQTSSTAASVSYTGFLVHHIFQFIELEPGELPKAATRPGVGSGMSPPVRLRPDDVLDLGIDGLGRQQQRVVGPR